MRICMVTTFYPPYHFGGDATYVSALSRALIARGHSVEVIHCEDAYHLTNKSSRAAFAERFDDGIVVHRLKDWTGFLSPLITQQTGRPGLKSSTLKGILNQNFDVVNFHNISLIGGPAILGLSQAPVTLYTLHEHWLLCPTHIFWKNGHRACDKTECFTCCLRSHIPPQLWRYTGLIRRSLRHVDTLISPSEYTANRHRENGISIPIEVIPLFSTLDPGEASKYRKGRRPQFLFVGRVTASKGIVPLADYFSNHPVYDLTIVGDGDLLQVMREQYAGYGNIEFCGKIPQPDLIKLYQQATALVFPSLAPETFGLSVVEAFACSTPAIVCEGSGGSSELIQQTGAGFIYRSEAELGEALDILASDSIRREELGSKARHAYRTRFTSSHHVDAYLGHIASIQASKSLVAH
ncbi:MAG: glycosyltransferase family 4 protein [Gammaproteobacteria bacterium]|nr:glycosyltransferase family 4 protein [Gammaproteobacteria bacterium]